MNKHTETELMNLKSWAQEEAQRPDISSWSKYQRMKLAEAITMILCEAATEPSDADETDPEPSVLEEIAFRQVVSEYQKVNNLPYSSYVPVNLRGKQ